MKYIELVINIPEEIYENIIADGFIDDENGAEIFYAISDGTQLPKGHGKLKDENGVTIIDADEKQ